jgi:hypothetical protein
MLGGGERVSGFASRELETTSRAPEAGASNRLWHVFVFDTNKRQGQANVTSRKAQTIALGLAEVVVLGMNKPVG